MHINARELLAIELRLHSFEKDVIAKHVKLTCNNICAVACIKHIGGFESKVCDELAQRILIWCQERYVHLTITYIPIFLASSIRQFHSQENSMMGQSEC